MPWVTPTLEELRATNRDNIQAKLRSGPMVPNSVMRVMADSNAGLAYLTLLYIDWLSKQLLPDTAETQWLDRQASIWLTQGRKAATFAQGVFNATGIAGTTVPAGSQLNAQGANGSVLLQTTAPAVLGVSPTNVNFVALTPGVTGLGGGSTASFNVGIAGVDGTATIASIADGVDEETDDELRVRVLDRIRQPPMGGDANDYAQWALEVPGVTRAWTAANEMGMGTVTVRFMMDDLRASADPLTNGFPNGDDVLAVAAHLDTRRPVAVKDIFVSAPIPEQINFTISNLSDDSVATKAAIEANVGKMLAEKAKPASSSNGVLVPAQEIYAAWVSDAIMNSSGVDHFDLTMSDHPMPGNGYMAVIGTITYL